MVTKLYIQPISSDNPPVKSETYVPSSIRPDKMEVTSEMMSDLNKKLKTFIAELTKNQIEGWSVEQVELGISFSADVKAWVINTSGSGTIKLTLKPNKTI